MRRPCLMWKCDASLASISSWLINLPRGMEERSNDAMHLTALRNSAPAAGGSSGFSDGEVPPMKDLAAK